MSSNTEELPQPQPPSQQPQPTEPKTRKGGQRKKEVVVAELKIGTIRKLLKSHSDRVSVGAIDIMRKYIELFLVEASKKMVAKCSLTKHKTVRKEEAVDTFVNDGVKNFYLTEEDVINAKHFKLKTPLPLSTIKSIAQANAGKSVSKDAVLLIRIACSKYTDMILEEADKIRDLTKVKTLEPDHVEHVYSRMISDTSFTRQR
jgi:histone H3/H4